MKLNGKKLLGIGMVGILLAALALVVCFQKGSTGTMEKDAVVQAEVGNERKDGEVCGKTEDYMAGGDFSVSDDRKKEKNKLSKMEEGNKEDVITVESAEKEPVIESKAEIVSRAEAQNYTPISDGWKVSKSVKGDITSAQKAEIDAMVEVWKNGGCKDEELKADLENYLIQRGVKYVEVSVTSQGYSLTDKIPEVELENGGNLYSFMGIYSTGKQNPQGTEKTVCYHWSVFIF